MGPSLVLSVSKACLCSAYPLMRDIVYAARPYSFKTLSLHQAHNLKALDKPFGPDAGTRLPVPLLYARD